MDVTLGFVNTFIGLLVVKSVMHEADDTYIDPEHLIVLLAGPIPHTSTQYMDFVEISAFY